ncbi:hypothetical protein P43SY_006837 [Pythium insidiosum]|uniref:Uncharacterized protein n=1 Tax=Pythium insidiosum TaxID=114742 RepID=A0AAD5LAE6_PYTIN|nr:hypothetical protein P43SY_006837 [Pythium insidiosum]
MISAWRCGFTTLGCTHDELFRPQYQRTNRTQRTKIKLVVYARFCPEESDTMVVGQRLPHSHILASLQSEADTTAEWILATPVHKRRPVMSARGDGKPGARDYLFEINPSARWLYAWDSGATKTQRLTTHVLEAVVFHRITQDVASQVSRCGDSTTLCGDDDVAGDAGDARDGIRHDEWLEVRGE